MFFVRFRRPHIENDGWVNDPTIRGNDFGFVVKSLDQPKLNIKTEEVCQYNKKRQIHTGYEVSPVTITLIDTMEGTGRRLWQAYLSHHFGDFRHDPETNDWSPDQTNAEMNNWKIGYGLVLPQDGNEADRYFFHTIDIFQVYGGTFTKTTLVNPRITSFDPDELDYEQMAPTTFRMQVTYETIYFQETTPLSADPELLDIFGDPTKMGGNPIDLPNEQPPLSSYTEQLPPFGFGDGAFGGPIFGGGPVSIPDIFGGLLGGSRVGAGGVLGSLGRIDFGSMAATAVGRLIGGGQRGNLGSELVYAGTNNAALAGIVQMVEGRNSTANLIGAGVSLLQRANPTTNPVVFDAARALIASKTGNRQGAGAMASDLVRGVLSAASATGTSPRDHVTSSSSGMSLSSTGLATANLHRSPTSHIGARIAGTKLRPGG